MTASNLSLSPIINAKYFCNRTQMYSDSIHSKFPTLEIDWLILNLGESRDVIYVQVILNNSLIKITFNVSLLKTSFIRDINIGM